MILLFLSISKSFAINLNEFNPDKGVIALMYHRFNENKYPSTNIRNEIFLEHLNEINNSKFEFIPFVKFNEIINNKIEKNYLLTFFGITLNLLLYFFIISFSVISSTLETLLRFLSNFLI